MSLHCGCVVGRILHSFINMAQIVVKIEHIFISICTGHFDAQKAILSIYQYVFLSPNISTVS